MTYVPLYVKSNFSFLEGASHPDELVETAHRLGLPALALTDRDGMYGVVRAHVKASELGLPLIIGAEVSLGDPPAPLDAPKKRARSAAEEGARSTRNDPGAKERVLLYAETREGYGEICQLLSRARLRCEKGIARSTLEEVCRATRGVVAIALVPSHLAPLREAFGRACYALLTRHRTAEERESEIELRDEAKRTNVPILAGNGVLYHSSSRRPLQDILTCIRHGTTLANAGRLLRPNAEHDLKSEPVMRALFADDLRALERTREIADRCRFSMKEIRYRYPSERLPMGLGEHDWLRELTYRGANGRYDSNIPDDVRAQLETELSIIHDLDYGGYFLTMWEIVQYCREQKILCQGRGSAANSAVCYCLGITAVDPVKMDLLFERFLSRERAEPPDIDLDIEHERREEVIQHTYQRYGRRHAAMVANLIRYRTKSAVRDVGKALGLSETDLDHLARFSTYRDVLSPELLGKAGMRLDTSLHTHLLSLAGSILDFPRHLSIHPGGFLLGHDPVDTLVPIEPATMQDRTVIQWDKYDVEALGLFKVDLLGLGALTVVRKSFALLHELAKTGDAPLPHSRELLATIDMARVPEGCAETYAMCSRGDTVGAFQIESRAQMSMLPRLKPKVFYDLVIQVAIVRPGPIQGGMVHPYLRRRNGEEPIELPHPKLRRVLERTMGVPIFQEQVMKLAVLVADYTPGESDQLRRDMAAWKSSGKIEQHRERLISRMIENGITPEYAERVFSQIRGFGEYGFPESHAASFALIAYVTSWLKCHYPAIFTCAMLNAQPMGFYVPSTLVEDAKRHGVLVRPICVHHSSWDCTIEDGAIRMGIRYARGLGTREKIAIEDARKGGPFRDIADFSRRTRLSSRALFTLSEAGAFDHFRTSRRDALWQARGSLASGGDSMPLPENTAPQFAELGKHEAIGWDYAVSHHSTRGHPMERFRESLTADRIPQARTVTKTRDGQRLTYVGMVICRQRPGTASGVTFYTLEDETGFVNVVVWTQVFERYEVIAKTASLLGVRGRIQSQHGVVHLVADELFIPDMGPYAAPPSRDFH